MTYIESLAFELEVEGFFSSFNALDFLKRYNNNEVSDYEFEIFIKQISYSRFLKDKKIDIFEKELLLISKGIVKQ